MYFGGQHTKPVHSTGICLTMIKFEISSIHDIFFLSKRMENIALFLHFQFQASIPTGWRLWMWRCQDCTVCQTESSFF